MRVGHLTGSISRNAGGLFWSVRSLSHHVSAEGWDVTVFSPSDEFSDDDIGHWDGLGVRVLSRLGPGAFGYAPGLASALKAAHLDVVHTHGLWMFPSIAARRWSLRRGSPLVISPRGMLDPWAVKNSAWKKQLAGAAFENAHLRQAACLHALCESEYQAIRSYGLRNPVAIIPNGVDLPESGGRLSMAPPKDKRALDERRLLFLSRVHPKKGLPNLLQAWAQTRQATARQTEPWRLMIAGWDQGGHQDDLQRLAEALGIGGSVQFVGPLFDEAKALALAAADAFVLPSFSEGLPMAVLEAWAAGLPVLMTPGCNLPEGFAADAALAMAPEPESITVALNRLFCMSTGDRQAMGARGRQLVEDRFAWPRIAEQMCDVYRWVLGQGPKPDSVVID